MKIASNKAFQVTAHKASPNLIADVGSYEMKKYYLFVNGRNFLVADFGPEQKAKGYFQIKFKRITEKDDNYQLKKVGFYTNMFVTAKDPKEAELKAVDILRKDKTLKDIALNQADDQPVIIVEEITEIDSFKGCSLPREGLALYDEKPRKRKAKSSNNRLQSTSHYVRRA